jgi:hypothetical protein
MPVQRDDRVVLRARGGRGVAVFMIVEPGTFCSHAVAVLGWGAAS